MSRNAADPRQVQRAERKDRERRKRELEDLRFVLSSYSGRRLLWRLLGHCSVFQSIWDPSSKVHHNAGRQDVGHFLMAELTAADEEAFFVMMREARDERKKDELVEQVEAQKDRKQGDRDHGNND